MDYKKAKIFLSGEYKGEHTIMAYAYPQTGGLNRCSSFSQRNVSVYLLPGSLHIDDTVTAYVPSTESFSVYNINDVKPIKLVSRFADKDKLLEDEMNEITDFVTDLELYFTANVNNKYHRSILLGHLRRIIRKEVVGEDGYKASLTVIRELQKTDSNPLLSKLQQMFEDYQRVCKISNAVQRRDKSLEQYMSRCGGVPGLPFQELERIGQLFEVDCKNNERDPKHLAKIVKAKVVAQVLYLAHIVNSKEFFTYEEVTEAFESYRPDLCHIIPESRLNYSISEGLQKLIDDDFVEYNDLLETYSLTRRCQAFALQLIETDNAWGK